MLSNNNLSLNKNPVYIKNLRSHRSTVFFCKKSNINPSDQSNSFREVYNLINEILKINFNHRISPTLEALLNSRISNCLRFYLTPVFIGYFSRQLPPATSTQCIRISAPRKGATKLINMVVQDIQMVQYSGQVQIYILIGKFNPRVTYITTFRFIIVSSTRQYTSRAIH